MHVLNLQSSDGAGDDERTCIQNPVRKFPFIMNGNSVHKKRLSLQHEKSEKTDPSALQ